MAIIPYSSVNADGILSFDNKPFTIPLSLHCE
jgi:hypothetical protein